MNVLLALGVVALAAALGGVGHGFQTYGGAVLPKTETKRVTVGPTGATKTVSVTLWLPGVVGQALFGALSGVVVFCVYTAPTKVVTLTGSYDLTFYAIGTALLAGLSGSVAVNDLIEKRQWSKLAPVLEERDPNTNPDVASGAKPIETLRMLAN